MKISLLSTRIGESEKKFVVNMLNSDVNTWEYNVFAFEDTVSKYVNIPYSVALSSKEAAIEMALRCCKVRKGDLVFCPTLAPISVCNTVYRLGAYAAFIDAEPESWNMSPKALRKALLDAAKNDCIPKAVIVSHLYGQCANMSELIEICEYFGVPIIEDASDALGSTFRGAYAGTHGDFGVYSFDNNKIVSSNGGGMLVSNDPYIIDKVRDWATKTNDKTPSFDNKEIRCDYKMPDICGCIGRGQMETIDDKIEKKTNIFKTYEKEFINISEIEMMPIRDYGTPNYWLSCALLTDDSLISPDKVINKLAEHGIEAKRIWKPLHTQHAFKHCRVYSHFNHHTETAANDIFNRAIVLPSNENMTLLQQRIVCETIKNIVK